MRKSHTMRRWTTGELKKMSTYREEGMTFKQIAKKLGRSHMATMQKWQTIKPIKVDARVSTAKTPKKQEVIKVNKQTLKSMELDVKGIKIHMVFS
tara:strand:- start:7240 stop:7524 length:285 start_codon:yes stop_codon:yes gene_type:complete